MKTINQVLLVLLFAVFSTVGFSQSQTTWPPESIVKRVVDQRYQYIEFEEEEDDEDDNEDTSVITREEWQSATYLVETKSNAIIYRGHSDYVLHQQ